MSRKTALPVQKARETLIELKDAGVYRDGRWLVRNVGLSGAGRS